MKLCMVTAALMLVLLKPASAQLNTVSAPAVAVAGLGFDNVLLNDSLAGDIRILPNPSSGEIMLFLSGASAGIFNGGDAVVYNSAGRPFAKTRLTTGTNSIFVSNLASGFYFVRLIPRNGKPTVRQFVVAR